MRRLAVVLSATALVIAVFGSTPLGNAVSNIYSSGEANRGSGTTALSNLTIVYKFTNSTTVGSKSKSVDCPGSTKAVSGGVEVAAPREEGVVPFYDGPLGATGKAPTGWFGAAHDIAAGPSDEEWSLGVFAVCASGS